MATSIKQNWISPEVGLVHWDGKLMATLNNAETLKQERLPILLSSNSVDFCKNNVFHMLAKNNFFKGKSGIKLLGVPPLPHKSSHKAGSLISTATESILKEWNCCKSVAGMVFDTTASNTGSKKD